MPASPLLTFTGAGLLPAFPEGAELDDALAPPSVSWAAGQLLQEVSAAANEVQTATGSTDITGGTYSITFRGATTADLAYNASAATVQAALRALLPFQGGNITVSGGALNTATPFTFTFSGIFAAQNIELLVFNTSSLTGSQTVTMATSTGGQGLYTMAAFTAVNEVQTITGSTSNTGGTFTLAFNGVTTSALAYNANAAAIQAALEALPTIGTGNVTVSGGHIGTATPIVITFTGTLGCRPLNMLVLDASSLTGTGHTAAIASTTRGSKGGAVAISKYPVVTDADGFIVDEAGRKHRGTIPVYIKGDFRTADLTGLIAGNVDIYGRMARGTYSSGILRLGV